MPSLQELELARRLGANETLLADVGTDERLGDISPRSFDAPIDRTGVPSVRSHLFVHARFGAKPIFCGVAPQSARIKIGPYDIYAKDLEIYGSFALKFTFHQAIAQSRGGAVDLRPLDKKRLPIERFAEAIGRAGAGDALEIHIEPSR